ncbi:MAG: FtsX-like permease family protein, partial [bacterium]|nr:FtsX-like permease family protein [bacterium]
MAERNIKPPKIAEWLLSRTSKVDDSLGLAGDFEEMYREITAEKGRFNARLWYWGQVMISVFPLINYTAIWSAAMLKNYLKTAMRRIVRNKVTSFINIFGLSIGIAITLLIYLFVNDEYSFDHFHENADNIYRIWTYTDHPDHGTFNSSSTPIILADDLKRLYPEIEHVVRISDETLVIKKGDLVFRERVTNVDPGFFATFSFPVLRGNDTDPLHDLNSIVLTREMAQKYFGEEDPIGKTLIIRRGGMFQPATEEEYEVSAVIDNLKNSSSISLNIIVTYKKFMDNTSENMLTNYYVKNPVTFLKIKPNTDIDVFRQKLLDFDKNIDQKLDEGIEVEYRLEELKDVHLNTEFSSDSQIKTSDSFYSYILAGLGGVILLIACINYMTLSIGLSTKKYKEVGIRKVMGAFRPELIKQFIGETLLSGMIAFFTGFTIAVFLLPLFNEMSGKIMIMSLNPDFAVFIFVLLFLIGIIAGSYPAFIQSGFDPIRIFRGTAKSGRKNYLSKSLVVIQFSLSIFLIVLTIVFQRQLNFISEKDLGFDQERLIELELNSTWSNDVQLVERLRNEIINNDRILNVAAAEISYGLLKGRYPWLRLGFKDNTGVQKTFRFNQVGYDYLETMGIELVMGRNFSREFGSDPADAVIINEAAVKYFNLRDPLNKRINRMGTDNMTIIGVVKDFHFDSIHGEIDPLTLSMTGDFINWDNINQFRGARAEKFNFAVIRISEGDIQPVLGLIEESWKKVSPNSPFEITFVDDTIQAFYESEQKWGKIINYASVFAIGIACLGLFGLSLITVQERIKEIGIRKVLGSSESRLISLLSKDLLILVFIANIISWPLAWYV